MTNTPTPKTSSHLSTLDPADIASIIENIEDARVANSGPPARVLPETLCGEISAALRLLEREIHAARDKRCDNR